MPSYILRNIDRDLWARVKARAATQGLNPKDLKDLIERLLRQWLGETNG